MAQAKADFWDRMAERYAARPLKDPEAYEQMLADIAARLTPEDRVLEIGCGTGSTAVRLGPGVAQWLGTDLSAEMLRIARSKSAPDTVRFVQWSADEPLPEAPFDAICAFQILHLVPDARKTLAVLHQQLGAGGLLICKTWCLRDFSLPMRGVIALLRLRGWVPPATALRRTALRQMIAEAGFQIEAEQVFGRQKHTPYIVARKV